MKMVEIDKKENRIKEKTIALIKLRSFLVLKAGVEPAREKVPQDFKSWASANSAT